MSLKDYKTVLIDQVNQSSGPPKPWKRPHNQRLHWKIPTKFTPFCSQKSTNNLNSRQTWNQLKHNWFGKSSFWLFLHKQGYLWQLYPFLENAIHTIHGLSWCNCLAPYQDRPKVKSPKIISSLHTITTIWSYLDNHCINFVRRELELVTRQGVSQTQSHCRSFRFVNSSHFVQILTNSSH